MRKLYTLLLLLYIIPAVNSGQGFLSDETNSGYYKSKPPVSSPELNFSFKTGGPVRSTPLAAGDKLFFGSGDGFLYCINSESGKEIWKFNAASPVHSSPAQNKGKIFFTNKEGTLFCLNASDGKLIWKAATGKELPYKWGFDYYSASPVVYKGKVYAGSGDGSLYEVNESNGRIEWKYSSGARLKSKPLIQNNTIYFGNYEGKLFAVDLSSKKEVWIFEAEGVNINCEEWGFDRRAFISSPTYSQGRIYIGNRDGFLYCLDAAKGTPIWKFDHKTSWVLSSPSFYNGKVFAGSSDKKFVNAVDMKSGMEIWQARSDGPVWSSVAAADGALFAGDYGGNVFALDAESGEYLWKFKTGDKIHSSPILINGTVYIGSDDGCLYSIKGKTDKTKLRGLARRCVFWEEQKNSTPNNYEESVRDFFVKEGYTLVDEAGLRNFLEERIKDKKPGVVLLARNYFPPSLYDGNSGDDLLRKYLAAGGKLVFTGLNPFGYIFKKGTSEIEDIDLNIPNRMFGLNYEGKSTDGIRGWNKAVLTKAGIRAGLRTEKLTLAQISPAGGITPLAVDEWGYYSMWIKNFGGREGTGLMQLWIDSQNPDNLKDIFNAVEFGLQ